MRRAPLRLSVFLSALFATALLSACGGGGREPAWNGRPLPMDARVGSPDLAALRGAGLEPLAPYRPRALHVVAPGEWGDSLVLVEFGDDLTAYAAFQELATAFDDPAVGTTVRGSRVCFRRGRWIGSVGGWNWKGATWYDGALALPGGAAVGALPEVFGSMLHQERVPGSERVLARGALGGALKAPVLAVALDCRGDTAWLYAAESGSPSSAVLGALGWRSVPGEDMFLRENPVLPPASLQFSKRGVVAVEGCFDEKLGNIWIKNQFYGLKNIVKCLNTLKSLSFD